MFVQNLRTHEPNVSDSLALFTTTHDKIDSNYLLTQIGNI